MRVFVINQHGEALMPCKPRKAKVLLREGKATVVSRNPFTIQLKYGSSGYKQDLTLGVDTGHSEVGISVVSDTTEFYSAEAKLRNDISEKVSEKRMYRRNRRNRLRYRKPRFNNRTRKEGWLPPSVQWKVDAHLKIIHQLSALMPVTNVILETGNFDPHKLKNPKIQGVGYQKGVQYGYDNVRAYVLARDSHQCQSGKKGCTKTLHVHHIKFKSKGGSDSPNNLITLCEKHHNMLHDGKLELDVKKHKCLKSATVMNTIRVYLLNALPNALETFGYITKANRQLLGLEKTHATDAFVVAGGKNQTRCKPSKLSFKRKNNRSIQKNRNSFKPSIRKQRYKIQPKDIVSWNGKTYTAQGMQNKGCYLKFTDGVKSFVKSIKTIKLVFHQKGLIHS